MRTIKKRTTPFELENWRRERRETNDRVLYPFDYESMRRDKVVIAKVEDGLYGEQGGICAYTGRKIERCGNWGLAGFHIEHLNPQRHCEVGEDCDYPNLVACWPEPNQKQATEYGAVKKDNWPSPAETSQYVSPLYAGCSERFEFISKEDPVEVGGDSNFSNWVEPSNQGDAAAEKTIKRLNLNHHELRALRWDAVIGALNPNDVLLPLGDLVMLAAEMEHAERDLDAGAAVTLDPFCFAVSQAVGRRIKKLSVIAN
jgi:uncharacterized protein (TIGR02646 family)